MNTADWTLVHEPNGRPERLIRNNELIEGDRCLCEASSCSRSATYFSARDSFGRPLVMLCGRHFAAYRRQWTARGATVEVLSTDDPRLVAMRRESARRDRASLARINARLRASL
jgi:hypothetical protein